MARRVEGSFGLRPPLPHEVEGYEDHVMIRWRTVRVLINPVGAF
ncbi:MAG TPA: hypothetical protein VES02_17180 [Dermatophilaceae bacterium]|nr:hypothetical protein [Dermatophilaceae bacterium]